MRSEFQDFTGRLCDLFPMTETFGEPIKMYSYSRPAYLFWNAFLNGLIQRGLTEKQAIEEVQSKGVRWMLDNDDKIEALGLEMAKAYSCCVTKGE